MLYCYKSYSKNANIMFYSGKGFNEMTDGSYIVSFGSLNNLSKYFLTPEEDRDRKIKEILNETDLLTDRT